jgi:hypothetical protein
MQWHRFRELRSVARLFVVGVSDGLCVNKVYVRLIRTTAELLLLKSVDIDGVWRVRGSIIVNNLRMFKTDNNGAFCW